LERLALIRENTNLPGGVGFGVSTPQHVAEVVQHYEAVIVGGAIVKRIAENAGRADFLERIADFVKPLGTATKRG